LNKFEAECADELDKYKESVNLQQKFEAGELDTEEFIRKLGEMFDNKPWWPTLLEVFNMHPPREFQDEY